MAKKFIDGENLLYALEVFEQKIIKTVQSIVNIVIATTDEINDLFKKEAQDDDEVNEEK